MINVTIQEVLNSATVQGGITVQVVAGGFNVDGVSAAWGAITGTLSDQTDLQAELNAKASASHTHALSALTQSGATNGQAIAWNGSNWVPTTIAASPGGSNTQLQFNNGGAFGGLPFTYNASTGLLEYAPTWNDGGANTAYTALQVNVTDTSSANGSRLLSLQTGGADRAYVTKRGNARFDFVSGSWTTIDDGIATGASNDVDVMIGRAVNGVSMRQGQKFAFSSNASHAYFDRDGLYLCRGNTGGLALYSENTLAGTHLMRFDSPGGTGLCFVAAGGRLGYNAAASAPGNTATPAAWAEFFIGTTSYRIPLYQ